MNFRNVIAFAALFEAGDLLISYHTGVEHEMNPLMSQIWLDCGFTYLVAVKAMVLVLIAAVWKICDCFPDPWKTLAQFIIASMAVGIPFLACVWNATMLLTMK